MSAWQMYWFVKLDDLRGLFIGINALCGVLLLVACGLLLAGYCEDECGEPWYKRAEKAAFVAVVCVLIVSPIVALLPSTKQMAAIYLVPKIVNNDDIRELAGDGMELMKSKMAEWIESTTGNDAQ